MLSTLRRINRTLRTFFSLYLTSSVRDNASALSRPTPTSNLVGYARVILAALSFYYMSTHPNYSMLAYGVSALLDAADGKAARALEQESKFGAVLDMVVDR
jgi:phosphatidylglycerophosphate synthase